ncbi:hypothetical protein WME79_38445 [Sorangium sp. So ce726]|uniref:hypothetical protein n=1 Tax=Sorangium sp. So ce726 TaxID=3133319 RepID=UPI003F5D96DF
MIPRTKIAGMVAAVALGSAVSPPSAASQVADARCTPARAGASVAAHPEPFRRAVEALVRSSAIKGKPWSCAGGVIELAAREGETTLTVTGEDGASISRNVASPDEIVPLGEALLAKPLPPPAAPEGRADALAQPAERGDGAHSTAPPPEPRVLLSALLSPRYAGGADLMWVGATAALSVPVGSWAAGAWVRYDALSAPLGERSPSLREVCVGAAASKGFALRKIELRASVVPSVAIVTRSSERWGREQSRVDGRIGVDLRGVLPIAPPLRAVVALDAELTPREIGGEDRASDDRDDRGAGRGSSPERFPAYTLGVSAGLEVAFR